MSVRFLSKPAYWEVELLQLVYNAILVMLKNLNEQMTLLMRTKAKNNKNITLKLIKKSQSDYSKIQH